MVEALSVSVVRASTQKVIALAAMLLSPTILVSQQAPVTLGAVERLTTDVDLGRIISFALGSDGRICVADDAETRVICFSAEGKTLWSVGRRGRGPGEFSRLYRIAVGPDNSVAALDRQTNSVTLISAQGVVLRRLPLPIFFSQPTSVAFPAQDTIVIAGAVGASSPTRDSAIHVFGMAGEVTLLKSFGQMPEAMDRRKLAMYGAGQISLTSSGTLLYSRRFPYEVVEYLLGGTPRLRTKGPVRLGFGPDSAMAVSRSSDGGTTYRAILSDTATYVGAARDFGGGLFGVLRTSARTQLLDLYDTRRNRWLPPLVISREGPIGGFQVDLRNSRMVFASTCDDLPCLKVIRFTRRPPSR